MDTDNHIIGNPWCPLTDETASDVLYEALRDEGFFDPFGFDDEEDDEDDGEWFDIIESEER